MARRGVGLDIGTSAVKIVEIEGTPQSVRVTRLGSMPLPEGALNAGVITNISEVSGAIAALLRKTKISSKKVLVAIAGQAVIVRNIKMPIMSKEELDSAIRWEAEKYLPFPNEEIVLDYQLVNRDEEHNELEILLVCAHNSIINSHLETLKEVGLQPIAIDIQPFALMRATGLENTTNSSNRNNIALLDIGAGTTDLTIVKNGVPRFTRIIPSAGQALTESISRNMQISFAEAEQMKITYSDALFDDSALESSDGPEAKVNFAAQEILRELVLEVRRSFDYYQLQQRREEISQLIVAGGGATMKNLFPFFNQELGITVTAGRAVQDFSVKRSRDSDTSNEILPMFMVAYGLALREVIPDAS